jgi:cobalt-zinc-cadmium resistance protein CzcA
MFDRIISFSLQNKLLIILATIALIIAGVESMRHIPLDAVPDITNNQVQIVSTAPTLAPQEVEQLITFPLEAVMTNIPDVVEVRSISRYGLSVITIVFEENVEGMKARQFVQEQIDLIKGSLNGITEPELMPITTGLGEIYQYVLTVDPEYAHRYDATELRTIQDWIVKRQLNGTEGIIEVSSFGGYLKQYEVALDPLLLRANGITIPQVITALQSNNENSGGSYIEKGPNSFYIRTEGRIDTEEELADIWVENRAGLPIRISDIATVRIGSAKRYGAMTMDGKGEVVGGITLMLKGANSSQTLENVKERMKIIASTLPEGVSIYPYLDRSKLIERTISTVQRNLIEGGLIVILVLLLLLGNLRAGIIVASVIPLSMLFALIMMRQFGISANLMSLGAIDFGIVIDGAVIIVEGLLHTLAATWVGHRLTSSQMDQVVGESSGRIYRSAAFGVLIILVVFVPILLLEGTEGKTFRPMAQTVGFAIIGSMILSMTYVPVMSSLFLNKQIKATRTFSDRLMDRLRRAYSPSLSLALNRPMAILLTAFSVFLISLFILSRLGSEFVPTLEEGDIAMQQSIKPGSSLEESIHTAGLAEKILIEHFHEVEHVVSKIGTAEVPTDPMAIEDADVMIILKDKEEWTTASDREGLMDAMKEKLAVIPWASFEFTQPIQLRFNELMTGSKADISVKIFGEDVDILKSKADEAALLIHEIDGAGDVKVDQTDGLQQLLVSYDRERMALHGIHVDEVNQIIRSAYAGEITGEVFEEERRFDLVVRLAPQYREELDLSQLMVKDLQGQDIPLSEIASVSMTEGPMLISREQARRFINIGVNIRNRDVSSLVADISEKLEQELDLPPGYEIQYGGSFENLQHATTRLAIAVPIALGLILLLLYLAFRRVSDTLIIFMAVPLSAVGGILALWLRDMPFSISSGIGFIALFGVSVLNGIVLLSAIRTSSEQEELDLRSIIQQASLSRLRPVLMTATVAALGFLPMALSTGSGAEVQRPLATVVIGGLISSTLLTLLVIPSLYYIWHRKSYRKATMVLLIPLLWLGSGELHAQDETTFEELWQHAVATHPHLQNLDLAIEANDLRHKAKLTWGPLNMQYMQGQINYDGNDQQLVITQDVSPLIRFQERSIQRERITKQGAILQLDRDLESVRFQAELGNSYLQWQYQHEILGLKEAIHSVYDQLRDKIEKRYALGELDQVEYLFYSTQLERIRQERNSADLAYESAERNLRAKALWQESQPLNCPPLAPWPVDSAAILFDKSAHLQRQSLDIELALQEDRLAIIQARQWDFQAGYFGQSLEQESLFQGFVLGASIPMDARINRVRRQQSKLHQEILQNDLLLMEQELLANRAGIQLRLDQLQGQISNYTAVVETDLRSILEKSLLRYQLGEIDFFELTRVHESLIDIELAQIEALLEYNQLILQQRIWNQ